MASLDSSGKPIPETTAAWSCIPRRRGSYVRGSEDAVVRAALEAAAYARSATGLKLEIVQELITQSGWTES